MGLYLQTDKFKTNDKFEKAMKIVTGSDVDILVFPEFCYTPFSGEIKKLDLQNEFTMTWIFGKCNELSFSLGRAIVFSSVDKMGTIFSVFSNAFAQGNETTNQLYLKQMATGKSPLGSNAYSSGLANSMFRPIIFKDSKIGLSICYDCNHAIFSRIFGIQDVDIMINSTGGNVVWSKWYKYNKARSIENHCYNFVTMGGNDLKNSYVFGFDPTGESMRFKNLMKKTERTNLSGTVYVFETNDPTESPEVDPSRDQIQTISKNQDMFLPVGQVSELIQSASKIIPGIFKYPVGDKNLIICVVVGADIFEPEQVLKLLYAPELKEIPEKRYLILNSYKDLTNEVYEDKLRLILKVRTVENFCAVILESDMTDQCFQSGKNRNVQVVQSENGVWGLDSSRMTGPDAIWKNKPGMKAAWRKNFEWLIFNAYSFRER